MYLICWGKGLPNLQKWVWPTKTWQICVFFRYHTDFHLQKIIDIYSARSRRFFYLNSTTVGWWTWSHKSGVMSRVYGNFTIFEWSYTLIFFANFWWVRWLDQHFSQWKLHLSCQALALEPARASAFQKCAAWDSVTDVTGGCWWGYQQVIKCYTVPSGKLT